MRKIFTLLVLLFSFVSSAQKIVTIAGGGSSGLGDGGLAINASIGYFGGLAVDKYGNVYIADANNERVRRVDTAGIITTIAGTGTAGYNGDTILATTAQLNYPALVCVDTFGNIYIVEGYGFRIRKVNIATGIITTFAGNGIQGYSGDGGTATLAKIDPSSLTFDRFGNMYFENYTGYVIRKVNSSGIISTIAGSGVIGNAGDGGPALSATLNPNSIGICTDKLGNIYITDSVIRIRKIDVSTGIITRVAGRMDSASFGMPYSGDGTLAVNCFMNPNAVAVDDTGNLYTADYGNNRILKINNTGSVYTVAGTGVNGFSGDGGSPKSAKLSYPENVVVDKCGNIYIADFNNKRVRKIIFDSTCGKQPVDTTNAVTNIAKPNEIKIYPNPAAEPGLIIEVPQPLINAHYIITDLSGKQMLKGSITTSKLRIDISTFLSPGTYFVQVINGQQRTVEKLIIDHTEYGLH